MKKLLSLVIALLVVVFFSNCEQPKKSEPTTSAKAESKIDSVPAKEQSFVPNQLVINFEELPNDMNAYLLSMKKLDIKVTTCPCSEKLILLEGPPNVDLHPDGEVATGAKSQGGNGTGVSPNYNFDATNFTKNPNLILDTFRQPKKPSASVIVSIIDSGVDFDNPITNPHLFRNPKNSIYCGNKNNRDGIYGLNMRKATHRALPEETIEPSDQQGHGTFINGIIAGKAKVANVSRQAIDRFMGNNANIAIRQLNVSFTPLKATEGTLFDALCGIHYSLKKGAKVINASWGFVTKPDEIEQALVFNTTFKELANPKNDVLLVVSAGNDRIKLGLDDQQRLAWPAAFSKAHNISGQKLDFSNNIITVGAWNLSANKIADFSNRGGMYVDLYAPGENILSIRIGREPNYAIAETSDKGTSFAAPFVTRTAAILRGLNPNADAATIKKTIIESTEADPFESQNYGTPIKLLRHRAAIAALPRQ